ncbi:hypothetical protein ON010_g10408 [Phytophthora cinnamomi]|nr:hypothetical protein ON010_g10408 [Phytophthora cinnamomi]
MDVADGFDADLLRGDAFEPDAERDVYEVEAIQDVRWGKRTRTLRRVREHLLNREALLYEFNKSARAQAGSRTVQSGDEPPEPTSRWTGIPASAPSRRLDRRVGAGFGTADFAPAMSAGTGVYRVRGPRTHPSQSTAPTARSLARSTCAHVGRSSSADPVLADWLEARCRVGSRRSNNPDGELNDVTGLAVAGVTGAPPPNMITAVDASVAVVARGDTRLGVAGGLREVDPVAMELVNVLEEVGAPAIDVVVVLDGAADVPEGADVAQALSDIAGGSSPPDETCPMVADACPVGGVCDTCDALGLVPNNSRRQVDVSSVMKTRSTTDQVKGNLSSSTPSLPLYTSKRGSPPPTTEPSLASSASSSTESSSTSNVTAQLGLEHHQVQLGLECHHVQLGLERHHGPGFH